MAKSPWDDARGLPELPQSLMTGEYSLSLFDVRSFFCYGAARALTVAHGRGMIHGDIKTEHIFLQVLSGRAMFIDWAAGLRAALDPAAMVVELVAPRVSMPDEQFLGLVAGYVAAAYERLDPLLPGYTDAFLEILGGIPLHRPKPFPITIESEAEFVMREVFERDAAEKGADYDAVRLFTALLAMEIAGDIDTLDVERFRRRAGPAGWIAMLLFDDSPAIPSDADEVERLAADLARHVRGVSRDPGTFGKVVLSFLRHASSPEARRILDFVIETCDVVALRSNVSPANVTRAHAFAQLSLVLRDVTLDDPATDERRLATMVARHHPFAREPLISGNDLTADTLLLELVYWSTRSQLLLHAHQVAEGARKPAPPYLWRALGVNRLLLMRAGTIEADHLTENVRLLLHRVVAFHHEALRVSVRAFLSTDLLGNFLNATDNLEKEADWIVELAGKLKDGDARAVAQAVSAAPRHLHDDKGGVWR